MSDPDNHFDDELVSANPNQRNWRGILIALLVIAGVLALIVTSVALLTPPDDGPRVRGRRLRLQDLLSQDLTPFKYNATWISGEDLVYRDPWGGISLMHAGNLSTRSLMSNTTFRSLNPVKFSLSADRRFLLLAQNVQKLYRHSYLAQYSVYDTLTTYAQEYKNKQLEEDKDMQKHKGADTDQDATKDKDVDEDKDIEEDEDTNENKVAYDKETEENKDANGEKDVKEDKDTDKDKDMEKDKNADEDNDVEEDKEANQD